MLLRIVLAVGAAAVAVSAAAATVERAPFGTADGQPVEAITLDNGHVRATIITWGAAIQSVIVPDRSGRKADIVLGHSSIDGYLAKPEYFGATVGRVANRIAKGRFVLDGRTYQTPVNNGPNALHGGVKGFDKNVWSVRDIASGPVAHVTLALVSPDGDQGYPGTLTATATYTLNAADELGIEYRATSDRATLVNLSNHSYWNLGGEGSAGGVMDHRLTIPADTFMPTDAGAIPTGEFRRVAGTPFDFRTATPIGARVRDADEQIRFGRGYDHNWVIARDVATVPRLVAQVEDPVSGRVLDVLSDQPGLQFYSGNFLDGTTVGKSSHLYRQGDAFVLEPQKFPDTPNHPEFGSVRLDPGQTYVNRIVFRFGTVPR